MVIDTIPNGGPSNQQPIEGEVIQARLAPVKRRRFRLTDARGVRRELAGLYHELRNAEIGESEARTGAFILRCLLESIRMDEMETRLTALERRT